MSILRIVWGRLHRDALASLEEAFRSSSLEMPRRSGLLAWHLGIRPTNGGHDVAGVTIWETPSHALEALGEDLGSGATLGRISSAADFSGADFYEIEATEVRPSTAHAAFLRVATGRLPTGSEVEIQQEMRRRLPAIDDEMTEAYLGRRLIATDSEIAFVSLWDRAPGLPFLNEPIWPDLARRKDGFAVRTFFAISGGLTPALSMPRPTVATIDDRSRGGGPAG